MFTFTGKSQRIEVCKVINGWLRDKSFPFDLVEDDGPVGSMWEAETTLQASAGQIVLINLISIVWNDSIASKARSRGAEPDWFIEALRNLDDELRAEVGTLVHAMFFGSEAVEKWLKARGKTGFPI